MMFLVFGKNPVDFVTLLEPLPVGWFMQGRDGLAWYTFCV